MFMEIVAARQSSRMMKGNRNIVIENISTLFNTLEKNERTSGWQNQVMFACAARFRTYDHAILRTFGDAFAGSNLISIFWARCSE
jgi:hypothetical protein